MVLFKQQTLTKSKQRGSSNQDPLSSYFWESMGCSLKNNTGGGNHVSSSTLLLADSPCYDLYNILSAPLYLNNRSSIFLDALIKYKVDHSLFFRCSDVLEPTLYLRRGKVVLSVLETVLYTSISPNGFSDETK